MMPKSKDLSKFNFLDKNQAYKTVWFLQTVKMVDGWFIQDFFKTSLRCKWGLYHFLRDSNVEFRKIENTRLSLVSSHSFFSGNLTSNKRRSLICYLNLLLVLQRQFAILNLKEINPRRVFPWSFDTLCPPLLFCSF